MHYFFHTLSTATMASDIRTNFYSNRVVNKWNGVKQELSSFHSNIINPKYHDCTPITAAFIYTTRYIIFHRSVLYLFHFIKYISPIKLM